MISRSVSVGRHLRHCLLGTCSPLPTLCIRHVIWLALSCVLSLLFCKWWLNRDYLSAKMAPETSKHRQFPVLKISRQCKSAKIFVARELRLVFLLCSRCCTITPLFARTAPETWHPGQLDALKISTQSPAQKEVSSSQTLSSRDLNLHLPRL